MLAGVISLLPARTSSVFIDGSAAFPAVPALFATRLTAALAASGRPIRLGHGAGERDTQDWDIVTWLRTADSGDQGGRTERRQREERADLVIDLHDLSWPVIRRVADHLAADGAWYRTETRAFFARRAATWDAKFGDDLPAYTAAITEAAISRGSVVLDIGCGTGRALPPLRQAVGPDGSVIALDLTPEMLAAARTASVIAAAALVQADARSLPFADASADAIFAAGLVSHLPDAEAGLREFARVTRRGGLLMLFHPTGRAALAARRGRGLSPGEPLAEGVLRRSTAASGWRLTAYDDASHRFFALAERC